MLAATCAHGHAAGTLQSWNLPRDSWSSGSTDSPLAEPLAALRRQPVSPNAAIDLSSPPGSGSGEFSVPADMMLADLVPAGIGVSQTMTGTAASGWARTFIGCCACP